MKVRGGSVMKKSGDILTRFAGEGVYPSQLAWLLLLPFRNFYLSPSKLAARLELKDNDLVLEIGCGPGYFSPEIAKRLPGGKLYLTDIQAEMVEKARFRLSRRHISNFDIRQCDGVSLDYSDSMFNTVFMVTVFGEISHKENYSKEIFRILKSGGILSISEQAGDPDSVSVERLKEFLEPEGFVLKKLYGKGRTFTANFMKPR